MAEPAGTAKTLQGKPGAVPTAPAMSAQAMVDNLRDRMIAMPVGRRNRLLAGIAFLVAVVAAMVWYVQRPDWKVLFNELDAKDAAQVTQELAAAGITYRMSADGSSVEVPSDSVDKARIEVAVKGMPQSGRLGFELFDKPNWVGSEFDERVNYQRALEGELEHTIQTLGVVRSVRVHLVLPQQSLFAAEDKVAKASVVLKLKRSAVDPGEADSIRSLVAGAVDNLSPADVVLVDADGRVNLKPHSQSMAEGDKEQELETKLVSLLEPLAGRDNVRATIRLIYDQGTEDKVDEVYDPTQVAALNMQRSEQTSTAGAKASGVPGTASNTPAAAAKGAVQGSDKAAAPGTPPLLNKDAKDGQPVYPQGGPQGQMTKQESGSYAVTKHTTHSEMGPGRLMRVTAAVVVNDRMVTEGTGKAAKTVWKPRTPEEMHRMEELAQAAVGFDVKRGDQVVIENMSFNSNAPEPPAPILDKVTEGAKGFLRTQPNLLRTLMIGVCGLLLVMVVLKPLSQQVMATLKEPVLLSPGARPAAALGDGQPAVSVKQVGADGEPVNALATSSPDVAMPPKRKGKPNAQAIFDSVTENIQKDPMPSTRLLQGWIASPEQEQPRG